MTSLSSCWHSSSLTFVSASSAQNHNHNSTELSPLSRKRYKMAKIFAVTFTLFLLLLVLAFALSEDVVSSGSGRSSRGKTKALPVRKRKVAGSSLGRLRGSEIDMSTTTTPASPPDEESIDELANNEENLEVTSTTSKPTRSKKQLSRISSTNSPDLRIERQHPPPEGCGECELSSCRSLHDNTCPLGQVLDKCSCCMVCGSGEGSRCYNGSIPNLPLSVDLGICGTGLNCLLRRDLDTNEPLEALCECRDRRMVCSNDRQTYLSECKLRENSHINQGLSIASWGPCVAAPLIPSPVDNVTVGEGEDASLSCEVKGFPSPVIHWEFLSFGSRAAPAILPGDDSSLVVTIRGGPEQTLTTSWIQIIAISVSRQGTYYCVATNPKGVARSAATVTISATNQAPPPPQRSRSRLLEEDYIS